jgi:hypothetical protein
VSQSAQVQRSGKGCSALSWALPPPPAKQQRWAARWPQAYHLSPSAPQPCDTANRPVGHQHSILLTLPRCAKAGPGTFFGATGHRLVSSAHATRTHPFLPTLCFAPEESSPPTLCYYSSATPPLPYSHLSHTLSRLFSPRLQGRDIRNRDKTEATTTVAIPSEPLLTTTTTTTPFYLYSPTSRLLLMIISPLLEPHFDS